jgi:hypothetical protein
MTRVQWAMAMAVFTAACTSGSSHRTVPSDAGASGTSPSRGGGTSGTGGAQAGDGGAEAASGGAPLGTGGSSGGGPDSAGGAASGGSGGAAGSEMAPTGHAAMISGCPMLPDNHIFNTPIDQLPTDPSSQAFLDGMGVANLRLDFGQSENIATPDTYLGIPYNVVRPGTGAWTRVAYVTTNTLDMHWDPKPEADCATEPGHGAVSPCTAANAPAPVLPIPSSPLVEGGIAQDVRVVAIYGHHLLLLDSDTCRLWEAYHAYQGSVQPGMTQRAWHIFGSATFDLQSNALRPVGWRSADESGLPILPLLLRADEASSGIIRHALRFTFDASTTSNRYTWPARRASEYGSVDATKPPMGQLFRLKSSFVIPPDYDVQSRAILQALKTYGMYLADDGSNFFVSGEPSRKWSDKIFGEVQIVRTDQLEAVDLSSIEARPGFDKDSAAVPP